MKKNKDKGKDNTVILVLVVMLLVGIAYLTSLSVPFMLDDIQGIRDNPNIGEASAIFSKPLYFLHPLLMYLAHSFGGLNPFFYRILNLLFHIGTVVCVYLTIKTLFNKERYAWITAVLFAVHPILVESVIWISALSYPQYSFFLMFSLYGYIRYRKAQSTKWYALSIVSYTLSMLSSEKAIAYIPMLLLTEWMFFSLKTHWKKIVPFALVAAIIGGLFMLNIDARSEAFESAFNLKREFYNPAVHIPYSVTEYIKFILFPKDLTLYHTNLIMTTPELLVRWVILLTLLGGLAYAYKKSKPVFYWRCFFLFAIAPTLIPMNIVWMVAERYVYLGTLGVIAAIAYPLSAIAATKKSAYVVYAVVGALTATLLVRTFIRTLDWQDEATFWFATLRASPNSQYAHNNVGNIYAMREDYKQAIVEYTIAIKLQPSYVEALYNLGLAYFKLGLWEQSEYYLKQLLAVDPGSQDALELLNQIKD